MWEIGSLWLLERTSVSLMCCFAQLFRVDKTLIYPAVLLRSIRSPSPLQQCRLVYWCLLFLFPIKTSLRSRFNTIQIICSPTLHIPPFRVLAASLNVGPANGYSLSEEAGRRGQGKPRHHQPASCELQAGVFFSFTETPPCYAWRMQRQQQRQQQPQPQQ